MLVTVDMPPQPPVDLEVAPGTSVAQILDFVGERREAWCGRVRLTTGHTAGSAPLLPGALVRSGPGPATWSPSGPAVMVVAGPDCGGWSALDAPVTVGTAAALSIDDRSLDAVHAEFRAAPTGETWVRDCGSVNGTVVHRAHQDGAIRRRVRGWARVGAADVVTAGRSAWRVTGPSPPAAPRFARVHPHPLSGWPDVYAGPVAPGDPWLGTVSVGGEAGRARALARAVVLARGVRGPDGGWYEEWMRWLPAARGQAGALTVGSHAAERADVTLVAAPDGCSLMARQLSRSGPPLGVSATLAEARARQLHATRYALPSEVTLGDLATDIRAPIDGHRLTIAAAQWRPGPWRPWAIDGPVAVIGAGVDGGCDGPATTLRLAAERAARPAVVIDPGRRLPHAAGYAREVSALRLRELTAGTVVILHRLEDILTQPGAEASVAALLAAAGTDLTVIATTDSPSGALTPSVRSRATTTIALRTRTPSQSRDLIGVPDAVALEPRGRALARTAAGVSEIQVAEPTWDATSAVRLAYSADRTAFGPRPSSR